MKPKPLWKIAYIAYTYPLKIDIGKVPRVSQERIIKRMARIASAVAREVRRRDKIRRKT